MILSKWDDIALVPTSIKGTLLPQTMGLIIGKSSSYQKNFKVMPDVINTDTKNDIKVIIKPLSKTIQIHQGQKIAQLLLLTYINLPNKVLKNERGQGQFGSTEGVFWIQNLDKRPFKIIKLNGHKFKGLLDTDADRTYVSAANWPSSWPIHKTGSSLLGLGSTSGVMQNSAHLK